jgi:hypothetical protein
MPRSPRLPPLCRSPFKPSCVSDLFICGLQADSMRCHSRDSEPQRVRFPVLVRDDLSLVLEKRPIQGLPEYQSSPEEKLNHCVTSLPRSNASLLPNSLTRTAHPALSLQSREPCCSGNSIFNRLQASPATAETCFLRFRMEGHLYL